MSLWDLCLRTIPDHKVDLKDVDGRKELVTEVTIVPIQFDFTHDSDYWEEKYNELRNKVKGLITDLDETL